MNSPIIDAMRVFISIGSNLGDRIANCRNAVRRIAAGSTMTLIKESSLYETEPWGVTGQGPFINSAIEVDTMLEPLELFAFLKSIESEMGRAKSERWGPRVIDLDIIFYGDKIVTGESLTIPHPSVRERAFVLVPLNEIAPDFIDPVTGKRVSGLLKELSDKGGVKKVTDTI